MEGLLSAGGLISPFGVYLYGDRDSEKNLIFEDEPMRAETIFIPVLLQLALTLSLFIRLAKAKATAVERGEVDEQRRALHADAWPDRVIQINNNIRNQFELPVLFYVICIALYALEANSILVHVLAWMFVLSRFIHMVIHTGSNVVLVRRRVFTLGFFLVLSLWFCTVLAVFDIGF